MESPVEPNSSTFNFKNLKKALLLTALFIAVHETVLARLWLPLVDSHGDSDFITWHYKENLIKKGGMRESLVFLGDSKVLGGIDTAQFEHETGIPSYNLAMQAMPIEGQYFVLRRYMKKNLKPWTVVVQPGFFLLNDLIEEEFTDKFCRYFISPPEMFQLLPDLVRMKMRAGKSLLEFSNRIFLPTYSRRRVIQDFIGLCLKGENGRRFNKNRKAFEEMKSRDGFFYFGIDKNLPEDFFTQKYQGEPNSLRMFRFEPLKMHDKYLRKLIEFCGTEKIRIVFSFGPLPEEQYRIAEKTGMIQKMNDYALSLKKDYPHLKLMDPVIWPEKNSNFFDFSHVNRQGVKNWTTRLADFFKNQG